MLICFGGLSFSSIIHTIITQHIFVMMWRSVAKGHSKQIYILSILVSSLQLSILIIFCDMILIDVYSELYYSTVC